MPYAPVNAETAQLHQMKRVPVPYRGGEIPAAFSARTGLLLTQVVKLNTNESLYPPVQAVRRALQALPDVHRYPETQPLRQALAAFTGVEEYQILVGAGTEVLALLCEAMLSKGQTMLWCAPSYGLYPVLASACETRAHAVRSPICQEEPFPLSRLLQTWNSRRPRLILLCSPNNPTSTTLPEKALNVLLQQHPESLVVVDEASVECSERPAGIAHPVSQYENLAIVRALSTWAGLSGLRVSYGLFPRSLAHLFCQRQCAALHGERQSDNNCHFVAEYFGHTVEYAAKAIRSGKGQWHAEHRCERAPCMI